MTAPTHRTVLESLTKARLGEIGKTFNFELSSSLSKDALIRGLTAAGSLELSAVLDVLLRDELKAICRAHGLDDSGRARADLVARILEAWKPGTSTRPPAPSTSPRVYDGQPPKAGEIVHVRHRQYFVEEVIAPEEPTEQTLVKLVCLDDDSQGRRDDVLWELELGARVLQPEAQGLGAIDRIDEPRRFAAYLHALKWSCVTATDARLFQAPFRAGIKLHNYQLTPLKKALELPRANLFIADDVGLGKTIEAGLVLQELLLRQRVDWALIVCPASVALQWQGEMYKRFGLPFEIYNRAFVGQRRQERGFAVNPWATHTRFIISYQTLRRPEYREPLLRHLGGRLSKSLLIMDEAHTAAPASASKYAIDSAITKVIRDVAPLFENRLFLSATPHNGHSNSFSALLEILDPQRFTRGVPVEGPRRLEPVMVRRLKSDLRRMGENFPERKVLHIELRHEAGQWQERTIVGDQPGAPTALGAGSAPELELSELLAEYTALMRPEKGRGRLIFINLQKRLLSSIEAFHRTLQVHAEHLGKPGGALDFSRDDADADERGIDDDLFDDAERADIGAASGSLNTAKGRARELLDRMLSLSGQHRSSPDAKVLWILEWIRRQQCPGVRLGGATKLSRDQAKWSDRRVILFTEYGDTKRYLLQILSAAAEPTEEGLARIRQFHGGMSDDAREDVQRAFNSADDPVRILLATDAAREGVNLQGHCADLFHFDIPWNPGRMEQRNGRIDRALQTSKEVRCMYFFYPQRTEDHVLRTVVAKVDTIQEELGSLGNVLMDRLAEALEGGIDKTTAARVERGGRVDERARATSKAELEAQRTEKQLKADIEEAGRILDKSQASMEFEPALLRDALDVGFELAGAGSLTVKKGVLDDKKPVEAFEVPALPEGWQGTLDALRPAKRRDEAWSDWRRRAPLPVVFQPPNTMQEHLVHLHLQHPLVQRVLSRFTAQGYSAHDLSRVTVVRTSKASARVIAFGRLSLFGPRATRLHDQVIPVIARWVDGGGAGHLKPFADADDRKALDQLESVLKESPSLDGVNPRVLERLKASAAGDFAALWTHIQDEADSREKDARLLLTARATAESDALRAILRDQRAAIQKRLSEQLSFDFLEADRDQRAQYEDDRKHMSGRLDAIDREIETEPRQIADTYRVVLRRLQPVGLVYLWPGTR